MFRVTLLTCLLRKEQLSFVPGIQSSEPPAHKELCDTGESQLPQPLHPRDGSWCICRVEEGLPGQREDQW